MPMPELFKNRLFPLLPSILEEFGSAAHIYDELGIRNTIAEMKKLFFTRRKGKNFFAVKACPNMEILKIMLLTGFGLDCASPTELVRARLAGAGPEDIMFTSNNTHPETFKAALSNGGCILNLDDITFIQKLPQMPKRICFRYNPGERRTDGSNFIIGNPPDQKYGLRHDQIVEAYARARDRGAEIFGIHTMYCSNQCDYRHLVSTVKMQLQVIEEIQDRLGIRFEFMNMGGGLGIPYRSDEPALDIKSMADEVNQALNGFERRNGYCPEFYTESGRYITGPHGIIACKCINRMSKYKEYVGVDFCDAADLLRADIYSTSFHGVIVLGKENEREKELVDVIGPLCENFKLGKDRMLPKITEGDILVIEDTGAHGIGMGSNYNGWGKSQELLFRPDNSIVKIARAQTTKDLLRVELDNY